MLPNGTPQLVQPSIGLFLSDTPPLHEPLLIKLESKAIDIPAGQAAYVVDDSYVLPADVDVLSVYPHAHYLAKEMQGLATLPDGTTKWLISIPSWDFRWQDQYRYASPVFLPKGTTLSMRFTYDNSGGNQAQPAPPAAAREVGTAVDGRDGRAVAGGAATGTTDLRRSIARLPRGARFWPTSPAPKCRSPPAPRIRWPTNYLAT